MSVIESTASTSFAFCCGYTDLLVSLLNWHTLSPNSTFPRIRESPYLYTLIPLLLGTAHPPMAAMASDLNASSPGSVAAIQCESALSILDSQADVRLSHCSEGLTRGYVDEV